MSTSTPGRAATCALLSLVLMGAASGRVLGTADLLRGRVVGAAGQPQKDVVVWIRGLVATAPGRAVLDQRNLAFLPHVLGVPAGTRVEMPNNDRVFHNVFSFKDGKRFDLGLYPAGTRKTVVFDRPGLSRVFCNIHPTMAAYVLAVDSSFVAVSGPDGRFQIDGVPPGRHEYSAWRPGADTVSGMLTVVVGQDVEVRAP